MVGHLTRWLHRSRGGRRAGHGRKLGGSRESKSVRRRSSLLHRGAIFWQAERATWSVATTTACFMRESARMGGKRTVKRGKGKRARGAGPSAGRPRVLPIRKRRVRLR
jgi:hypothetical protein